MIDFHKISNAIKYYEQFDFKPINVAWTANEEIIKITLPQGNTPTKSDIGLLIGSAEQSFLNLVYTTKLKGKFQATTPCFRKGEIDFLHQEYFIKTELFNNLIVTEEELGKTIKIAVDFYKQYLPIEIIQLDTFAYDIIDSKNKIELGSYGIRKHPLVGEWIYATGCAEPRLSIVLDSV